LVHPLIILVCSCGHFAKCLHWFIDWLLVKRCGLERDQLQIAFLVNFWF